MIRAIGIFMMIILMAVGSYAAGGGPLDPREPSESVELPPCERDGNNTPAHAAGIEIGTLVVDVVCPEDPVDFYSFHIPEGANVEGSIMIITTRDGTTVRLTEEARVLFRQTSTEPDGEHRRVPVEITDAPGATYYMRVNYEEGDEGEHYFGIQLDLEITGCFPEGNETRETAERIMFGESNTDVLCADDTVDWYHIHTNSVEEADEGWIKIRQGEGDLNVEIYDRHDTLLHSRTVGTEQEKFDLGDISGITHFQSYYVKLEMLDPVAGEEYEYTIRLGVGDPTALSDMVFMGDMHVIEFPIWGTTNHDMYNTSRTFSHGPSNATEINTYRPGSQPINIYNHPVVDPRGNIYFIDQQTPTDRIRACNVGGNIVWTKALQDDLFGLHMDSEGYWSANYKFIYHFEFDHNQSTPIPLPEGITGDVKFHGLYDGRLYFSGGSNGFDLWCVDKSGNIIYLVDAMGPVRNIAVDRDNNLYVLSYFNLSKFDEGGGERWRRWFRDAHRYGETIPGPSNFHYRLFGPLVGKDGRIVVGWIEDDEMEILYMYNPDGSRVNHYDVSRYGLPYESAIDIDGNYCIVNGSNILSKYNQDLFSVWNRDIPGDIDDILIDSRGNIYVAYHVAGGLDFYAIRALNSEGGLLWQEVIEDFPYFSTHDAWLMVDNGKRLVLMTSTARMVVIEGTELDFDFPTPGTMQDKSSKGTSTLRPSEPAGGLLPSGGS